VLEGLFILRRLFHKNKGEFDIEEKLQKTINECLAGRHYPKSAKYAADIICCSTNQGRVSNLLMV
jgi:hypothetical protein